MLRASRADHVRALVGGLAIVGFVLSAIVHACSLAGIPVEDRVPLVWGLHFGIFVVFLPAIWLGRRRLRAGADFRRLVPRPVGVFVVVTFVYALLNFGLSFAQRDVGVPQVRDGHYVLLDKGRFVRELTHDQYLTARVASIRAFSGHWMLFYAVGAALALAARREG